MSGKAATFVQLLSTLPITTLRFESAMPQYPPIRACIFDVDGTLINSEDIYTEIYNKILGEYGRPAYPWEIKATQQSRGTPVSEHSCWFLWFIDRLTRELNASSTGHKSPSPLRNGKQKKRITHICSKTAKCFLEWMNCSIHFLRKLLQELIYR